VSGGLKGEKRPAEKESLVEPAPIDNQSGDLTGRALRLRIRQQELLAEKLSHDDGFPHFPPCHG
jgi:hypothetical protein